MRKIILASASPRRRELLEQIGLEFEVIPSQGEEVITKQLPREVVEELSRQKAEEVAGRVDGGIVIGSDTVVCQEGRIMGKPADREDARGMLRRIQGGVHSVFTGVTVLVKDEAGKITDSHTFSRETKVRVYPMTEEEIEGYLNTGRREEAAGKAEGGPDSRKLEAETNVAGKAEGGSLLSYEWQDKAGAYGIQGAFAAWVESIEGDYNNVVGLPVSALWQVLKKYV